MSKYVYLIYSEAGLYKIGVSNDVEKRLSTLRTGSGHKLCCLAYYKTKDKATNVERALHKLFDEFRAQGEWFAFPEDRFSLNKFESILERYGMTKMDFDINGKCVPYPKEVKQKLPFGRVPDTIKTEHIEQEKSVEYWRKKYGIKTKG